MHNRLPFLFLFIYCFGVPDSLGQRRTAPLSQRDVASGTLKITAGAGLSYYMGDLRSDMNLQFIQPQFSVGANYRLSERLSARGELNFYRLTGAQAGGRNWFNNLSFRASNPAFNVALQLDAVKFSSDKRFRPYLFGGAGLTYITPKAKYEGAWYSLAPLMTEKVAYNRSVLFFLGGMGFGWKYNDRWGFALELSNNYARSDYLDDVSTVYPDPAGMSEMALKLSDRRPELDPALLPPDFPRNNQPGFTRGNPKVKDSFGFLTIKAEYLLSTRHYRAEKRKTRCFVP
jgi:hypothetical protein